MLERIVRITQVYDYTQMMEDLHRLQEVYPFIRLETIGLSAMGKPIPAVVIGSGEKKIHFNASFHANEWITTPLLMAFLEDYAESVNSKGLLCEKSGAELSAHATLYAVPMVNPDGVDLVVKGADMIHPHRDQLLQMNGGRADFTDWKANIRGVDLNDQFPANWEIERDRRSPGGPGPRDYAGAAPLSEPEAAAMAAYTRRCGFDLVVALHTQGREIYWNYRDLEPPIAEQIGQSLAELSGYQAIKLVGSDAGYKDWFIQEFRKPGFTVEVGYGVNPLPISMFSAFYQELLPILEKSLLILHELEA